MNAASDFDDKPDDSDELPYRLPAEIELSKVREAFDRLELFGGGSKPEGLVESVSISSAGFTTSADARSPQGNTSPSESNLCI